MPKLSIDGQIIDVEPGTSVLEAAKMLGIEIPHFCYHERLSVPANCRMCLVDLENGPPKPVPACATICAEGMVVHTNSERVRKARHGVMELILINHPLDCPVCDQGGECDLQDQAYGYGLDRSRFHEPKRIVKDKALGPLIKTIMTRCINCTRCIRFAEEIAGIHDLGQLHRGENAEIGTYIEKAVGSELSGNLIDICPVGALTAKPYAYRTRSWELVSTDSIDVHDAFGSNIRIDSRADEVIRILPRVHEALNEAWISDKTRFAHDGLLKNRLDRPWIRKKKGAKLEEVSWEEAFALIAKRMKMKDSSKMAALAGDLCDLESMVALKDLMMSLGSKNLECRVDGARFDTSKRYGYLFNSMINRIEEYDVALLIGTDLKTEAPLLWSRLRRAGVKILKAVSPDELEAFEKGEYKHTFPLKEAKKPLIIAGMGTFRGSKRQYYHALCCDLAKAYKADFNMLHNAASRVGALEIGFVPKDEVSLEEMDLIYLLNMDEFNVRAITGKSPFIIYQGHHGDENAQQADVVLPGCAYTEKDAVYVNMEGRPQQARKAVKPPGHAKEDWKILRALSDHLEIPLPYNSLLEIRERIAGEWPHLTEFDSIKKARFTTFGIKDADEEKMPEKRDFTIHIPNFYQSNSISRASETMAKCVDAFVKEEG